MRHPSDVVLEVRLEEVTAVASEAVSLAVIVLQHATNVAVPIILHEIARHKP